MTTDDAMPTTITSALLAEDLSLSNEEGTSWFGYGLNCGDEEDGSGDTLTVEMYGATGEIVKRFVVALTITEIPESR